MNGMQTAWEMTPIGMFHGPYRNPYDAPRQASRDSSDSWIELASGQNFEQALQDLDGCTHIWIVYVFHKNQGWKPKVQTPRTAEKKIGLFATRSPYRPNPIGLSAVRLKTIRGRKLFLENADLLDGTPILDIKPYLAYADSIPDSKVRWVDESDEYSLQYSKESQAQLEWLMAVGTRIQEFLQDQLRFAPTPSSTKRIKVLKENESKQLLEVSYRTWRIHVSKHTQKKELFIKSVKSGYTALELNFDSPEYNDPYGDKDVHRAYLEYLQED